MPQVSYTQQNVQRRVREVMGNRSDYKLKFNKQLDTALQTRQTDRGTVITFNLRRIHRTGKLDDLLRSCIRI